MRFRDFSITIQVSITIFVVFASLTGVLIFLETNAITNSFIEHRKILAMKDIQGHSSILTGADFSLQNPIRAQNVFSAFFKELAIQDIVRIKVWSPEYQVVFSDDEAAVGGIFRDNTELGKALKGETSAEVSDTNDSDSLENVDEKQFGEFLEIYVPIFETGQSKPIGVIEEYVEFRDTKQLILKTNFFLIGFVMLIFVIFYSIAFFLIHTFIKIPLGKLKDAVNEFEKGNFSKKIEFNSKNEIGQLTSAFNHMALRLKNYYVDLEDEVKQKTKQLSAALAAVKNNNQELEETKKSMLNVLEDLRVEKGLVEEVEAKDEAMLASIGEGVIAIDNDRKVLLINKIAENILGWKKQNILGKIIDSLPLEDSNGQIIPLEKRPTYIALKNNKTITTPTGSDAYLFIRPDSIKVPITMTVAPILMENKMTGAVIVFHDVTKEAETDRAKTEFISIASHQLRTPLSAIFWLVDSLKASLGKKKLDKRQEGYLNDLSLSINQAVKLVEDLLRVSRIQLGTSATEEQKTNIFDFIEQFVNDMHSYATFKNHEIVLKKMDSKCSEIWIDQKILYIIMQNLVSNAIDYSPNKTMVSVAITQDNGMTKISIANQGPSIPPEEQKHLFQKFYRGESARKLKISGTGLGLFIVKSFVEQMGGQMGFKSEEGKETVFWFTVPCVRK